jgi:solute carrier family 13 (sodium-dependent dicarboxylate transporter), member 2/3/5
MTKRRGRAFVHKWREASEWGKAMPSSKESALPPSGQSVEDDHAAGGVWARRIGIGLGVIVFLALLATPAPEGLDPKAWKALAILALMIIWWVSEAIPVAATALVPLGLLPLMGIAKPVDAAAPYADPIIFLFICGFMVAVAIERSGLHRRIALSVLAAVGSSPGAIVGGFMVATTLLSMWISNTATALMMTPIAIAVAQAALPDGPERRRLMAACVLGVAYCASIGGVGTPVGSPTNLIGLRWLEGQNAGLTFPQWMSIGVSIIVVMVPLSWIILTRIAYRLPKAGSDAAAHEVIKAEARALGPMRPEELRVSLVFGCVALAWILREPVSKAFGLTGLTDMVIAVMGAVALFLIPSGNPAKPGSALLDWSAAERIPWGIAILFGGGLSMAAALEATGMSAFIGSQMQGVGTLPVVLIVLTLVGVTVFASELASNVATLTAMLPVLTAIVVGTRADPLIVGTAATFAASFGFMLPIATAANAIAYGTGAPRQGEMLRVGLALNVLGVITIASVVYMIVPLIR